MIHNYYEAAGRFIRENNVPDDRVSDIAILHDDWCGFIKGGRCDCDPEVKLMGTHPTPRRDPRRGQSSN